MFRSCHIIIRDLCSLLELYYSIQNSIRICKRGVVAAYHVVWACVVEQWLGVHCVGECVVEQWLGVRRMLSNKRLVDSQLWAFLLPMSLPCVSVLFSD